jgi:hypothetical protein
MAAKKISKIEMIPNSGTPQRNILLEAVPTLAEYNSLVESGWRFYSAEELTELENKYPDGMTWEEIESELISYGIEFKKPTFRAHIQKNILPEASGYRNVNGNRIAVYPADIISHINLNRYILKAAKTNDILEYVERAIFEYDGMNVRTAIATKEKYQDLFKGIVDTFARDIATQGLEWGDIDSYRAMFSDVLKYDEKLKNKAISYVDEIEEMWKPVGQKIYEFMNFLEFTKVSPKSIKKLLHEEVAEGIGMGDQS